MDKFLSIASTFIFVMIFFCLLWIFLGSEEIKPDYPETPQECSDLYYTLPANVKSQYYGSEDYINSCVE